MIPLPTCLNMTKKEGSGRNDTQVNRVENINNNDDSNINSNLNTNSNSNSSSSQPRRSARLQQKRSRTEENETNEAERSTRTRTSEEEREIDAGSNNNINNSNGEVASSIDSTDSTNANSTNTDGNYETNGTSTESTESTESTDSTNTTDTTESTRIPTSTRGFRTRISSSTTRPIPFPFPPPSDPNSPFLSFTFTFENGQLIPATGSVTELPVEIQSVLQGVEGGTVIGITGMSLPLTGMSLSGTSLPSNVSSSDTQLPRQTPNPPNHPQNSNDFLSLARQLIQIIFRARSGDPAAESEMEGVLNDFMSRIFGGAASSAPAGLSPDRINQLSPVESSEQFDCSICRETACPGTEKCVQLPCKHSFHFECIEPWLSRVASCPICRKVINE